MYILYANSLIPSYFFMKFIHWEQKGNFKYLMETVILNKDCSPSFPHTHALFHDWIRS